MVTPTYAELVRDGWAFVRQQTGLTNDSESGVAYNIVRCMAQYVADLWAALQLASDQSQLSTATGAALGTIGAFFGVPRLSVQTAGTEGGPPNVTFTNSGGIGLLVPQGTRLWPDGDLDRAYFTLQDVTVPAGGRAYVEVAAARPGDFYNISAGGLDRHSIPAAALAVTNQLPIQNGANLETDVDYRLRISRQIATREGSNLTALREALLVVPGVRDLQIQNAVRGAGTVDILLYGYDRYVPDPVLAEAQAAAEAAVAVGVSVLVKPPALRLVDAILALTLRAGGDAGTARQAAALTAHGYLDNLPIEDGSGNGTLFFEELAARVQEAHPDIVDSRTELTVDDLPALRANQTAEVGERFVSRTVAVR